MMNDFVQADISNALIGKDKEPKFHPRGELNYCEDSNHDWKLLIFDIHESPMIAMGMCRKCALLEGGWAKYD